MKFISIIIILFAFSQPSFSQWSPAPTGINQNLVSISAVDNNIVWTCGWGGYALWTTNGGSSWNSKIVTADTAQLFLIHGIDQNRAVVVSKKANPNSSTVWKTSNGGSTWTQVFFVDGLQARDIEIFNDGTGFMLGDPIGGNWALYRTSNFGDSWSTIPATFPQTDNEIGYDKNMFAGSSSKYWFGTTEGNIHSTTNAGLSWNTQVSGEDFITRIWFNGNVGFAGGFQKIRSTNEGSSWIPVTIPSSLIVSGLTGVYSTFWLITSSSPNILVSNDSGKTWAPEVSLTQTLPDMTRSRSGNSVWVCGGEGGVWHRTYTVSINTISTEIPEKYSLSQNYPNPFNPSTKVKFDVPKSSFVKLAVYDILGREVSSLVNEQLQAGTYEYEFNAAKLNSGTYFYKLSSAGFSEIKKMVLIK
jgi:photosystem II stability/assembly factor-like uncharacterized protein